MYAVENVSVVTAFESELDKAMENFYRAHDDYHRSLTEEVAQAERNRLPLNLCGQTSRPTADTDMS